MSWAAVGAAAISVGGSYLSSKNNKKAAEAGATQTQELDPRVQALLYGDDTNGNKGLLSDFLSQYNAPQSQGLTDFNNYNDSYLGGYGSDSFMRAQQAAQRLQATNNSPAWIKGASISAPSQNSLDLRSAFDRTINGDAAQNPYLTRAIQGGLDQSTNTFNQQQRLATQNLQENILPGIKSNSIVSGGYGGSRQGIAEGRAIGDFSQAQQDAINQYGQNNTNAAVGAQANAFESGQNRSLQALLNLSGQQYGVAGQNAAFQQQESLANQQADMQNRAQNTQAQATGIGLSSGLLGQAYGYAQNANNAGLNRATQVAGAISPFTGLGATTTQTQPYYSNNFGNAIGGAAAGLGLYNQFRNSGAPSNSTYAANDWFTS